MELEIAGIPVRVLRKDIKNMHLYVKPPDGRVEVSAPTHLPDESVAMFVCTRLGWIRQQQERFDDQPRQTAREFVSGETLYVWGKPHYLLVDYSARGNSLVLSGNRAVLTVRRDSTVRQRAAYVNEWYRGLLKAEIAKRLPRWEALTGLHCRSWQTRYMTTCWGTCNPDTGKIWLNLQLAKKNTECLDFVLLHELVHLREDRHSVAFVKVMDRYMPYWREVRRALNGSTLDGLPVLAAEL